MIVAAVLVSGMPAVAKGAFLRWETWEPSGKTDLPVSVGYVWDSNYAALTWPERKTTVLTIEAPPISRYWRATTLDVFNGDYWLESTLEVQPDPLFDPLMPAAGRNEKQQLRARVKVEALQDNRLIGASVPVRYELDDKDEFVLYQSTGTAYIPRGVPRGSTYTSWSYAPRPTVRDLARSAPIYSSELDRYLVVQSRTSTPPSPHFGSPGRLQAMDRIFAQNPSLHAYRPLYERALAIAGDAPSPYAAVVELETSFRDGQSYVYDQNPTTKGDIPPLVDFVTRTQRRLLPAFRRSDGPDAPLPRVPARVAAGFSSGTYDADKGVWKVTDHDAHAWVEVWFRGYGWLPFDPTPGRGAPSSAAERAVRGRASTRRRVPAAARSAASTSATRAGAAHHHGEEGAGVRGARPRRRASGPTSTRTAAACCCLLALVARAARGRHRVTKLALRRARYLTRDPRRVAAACRQELADYLLDQRIDAARSATLHELGALVRHELAVDPDAFVGAATAARFGPPAGAAPAARRARRELRALLRGMRVRLRSRDRVRGLLSLRSFGFAP